MRCPSAEEIYDLLRGKLPQEASGAVRTHLAGCSACAETRAWLEGVLAATAEGPLAEPPAEILEKAFAIVTPGPARAGSRGRGWSLSRLVLDTFGQPLPGGVRGAADTGRRLLYRAADADLDLEVREAAGDVQAFRVTGQLLVPGAPPPGDLFAALWTGETVAAHASGDDLGLFVFPVVPPGTYRLEVWVPAEGRGIRIEPLELEPPAS